MAKAKRNLQGDEIDRIGRLGEQRFENLCTQARLGCSRLIPDRTGVDFVVEFPPEPYSAKVSYDARGAPRSVVVQVKTVTGKERPAVLALSAAERLAKRSEPAIVCWMLHDEASDEIIEMRLVHLLNDGMARVLRALRGASRDKKTDLRQVTISFPARLGFGVAMDSLSIRQALEALCAPGMDTYAMEKRRQFLTLGYQQNWLSGSVTFKGLTTDELADAFLGLREAPVEGLEMLEERFGIKLPFDQFPSDLKGGTVTITPDPVGRCRVRATTAAGAVCEVTADLFVVPGPVISEGPVGLIKWGMGHVRLDWGVLSANLKLDFNLDGTRTASEWVAELELMRALLSEPCRIDVVLEEGVSRLADIDWAGRAKPGWLDKTCETARVYAEILKRMRLGDVPYSNDELRANSKAISIVHGICHRNIKLEMQSEAWEMEPVSDVPTTYVSALQVLGKWVGMAVPMTTSTSHTGDEIQWTAYRSAAPSFQLLEGDEQAAFERFRELVTEMRAPMAVFSQKPGDFMVHDKLLMHTDVIDN